MSSEVFGGGSSGHRWDQRLSRGRPRFGLVSVRGGLRGQVGVQRADALPVVDGPHRDGVVLLDAAVLVDHAEGGAAGGHVGQQEVEDGIATFINSRDQVEFLQRSVVAAEGALRIALLQYREGILDFTTVLTAEQNLYQAQNNLVLATGSIALGLITTYRALGGGWQIREGRDFVPLETQREMSERSNWGTLLTPDLLRPDAPGLPSPQDRGPPVRLPEW